VPENHLLYLFPRIPSTKRQAATPGSLFLPLLLSRLLAEAGHLARSARWDVLASSAGLSTGDLDTGPSPAGAGTAGTENVDVGSRAGDGTSDTGNGETCDGDTVGWGTSWGTVLVILLDDDTILCDARHGDALEGDA
jgi:hypothetical protein